MEHASDIVSDQTSSRELLVDLSGVGRGRLAAELERSLREAIRSGRLRPGARLPSTRSLAVDLGVSRSVVVQAYDQLAAEGYLVTRPGAAARVSGLAAATRVPLASAGLQRAGSSSAGSSPVGRTSVGSSPVGASPVGSSSVGASPVGSSSAGPSPVGSSSAGPSPVGSSSVGSSNVGSSSADVQRAGSPPVGSPPVGASPVGSSSAGASPVGSSSVGSSSVGSSNVGSSSAGPPPAGPPTAAPLASAGPPPARAPEGGADPALSPARPGEVDLRPGSPYLAGLPRATYARAVRRALATLTDAELGYGDPRGLPRLREALADYLGRVRGAMVDPEDLVVVNGFAQGLVVVSRLLAGLGITSAVVEDPGSFHTSGHLAAQGVAPAPVPVDAEGLDVGAIGPGLRAALVTPAHQFPTGAVLSPDRRRRLVEWAERVDGLVVEDDYDAEYRYDHHPVGAVQGMAPGRVVLGGSTSKTLAPGLRLGWLAVPPALSADAAGHKRHIDIMAPVLEQAALAELLASGAYERHIRRSRARYRRLRDVVVEVLAGELPGATVRGTSAGLHLLVETPAVADEAAVVASAARRGVRVVGTGPHRRRPGPTGFVIGFGHLPEPTLRRGLRTLAAVVRGASG